MDRNIKIMIVVGFIFVIAWAVFIGVPIIYNQIQDVKGFWF